MVRFPTQPSPLDLIEAASPTGGGSFFAVRLVWAPPASWRITIPKLWRFFVSPAESLSVRYAPLHGLARQVSPRSRGDKPSAVVSHYAMIVLLGRES